MGPPLFFCIDAFAFLQSPAVLQIRGFAHGRRAEVVILVARSVSFAVALFLSGLRREIAKHRFLWSHTEAQRRKGFVFPCVSAPLREKKDP